MTQRAALQIIAEASQDRHIVAELDTKQCARYRSGAGFRVKLTLRSEHRVLTIINAEDWEPIRDAWAELLAA